MSQTVQLFPLGQIVATPGALEALEQAGQAAHEFLTKHAHGEWGELSDEDWRENNFAVTRPLRLLSAYRTRLGERLWVITEADRSVTTCLLPDEY